MERWSRHGGIEGTGMYTVYIIKSDTTNRHYIGVTTNLRTRLIFHNEGANRSTRKQGPWRAIYSEDYDEKRDALVREKEIKRYKGGEAFKKLIR